MAKKSKTKKERACLRCGCTDMRGCGGGCSWVFGCDVCDACLTPEEDGMYQVLLNELLDANTPQLVSRANGRLTAFAEFLDHLIAHEPIPYVPVKGGDK